MKKTIYLFAVAIMGIILSAFTQKKMQTYYYKNPITNTFGIYDGAYVCVPGDEVHCLAYQPDVGMVWLYKSVDEFDPLLTWHM